VEVKMRRLEELLTEIENPPDPALEIVYHVLVVARSTDGASSEQVRRPIFKEGLDQWRNFVPWQVPSRSRWATC
jgi:hypothetical protein